jgi:site-specific recombinase XerD
MINKEKIAEWKVDFTRFCKAQNKANNTIDTYWGAISCFILHFNTMSIDRIGWKEIADYILKYDNLKTIAQKRYAIQLFYSVCFRQKEKLKYMPTPKIESVIPQVLNVQECYNIFSCIDNLKHQVMIKLSYSCALRMSELLSIRINHIDGKDSTLFIYQSKGAKDRKVPIPEETLILLREYFKKYIDKDYKKDDFLFTGKSKDSDKYCASSVRAILKRAVVESKILKKIKFHTLRHSRATHLYNAGMQIRDIAKFLGHNNIKTTEIYIHTGIEDLQVKIANFDEIIKQKLVNTQKLIKN